MLAGGGLLAWRRLRTDPALEMMRKAPARLAGGARARGGRGGRRGAGAAGERAPLARRRRRLRGDGSRLAADGAGARRGKSVNRALAAARLPYFVDVQRVNGQPIALSYELVARVPWRIGARTVDVLRLRRLDTLNIELGLYGATDEGLPVVLLDRIEAALAGDVARDVRQTRAR